MEILVGHLVALGLQHPTEPTVQKITAVMIMATQGSTAMYAMPPAALHESFKQVKKRFKALARKPQAYILELPMSPDTYRKKYPDMYKALYQDAGPVHCPLSYPELAAVTELVPMRPRNFGKGGLSPFMASMPQMGHMGQLLQMCQQMMMQQMGTPRAEEIPGISFMSKPKAKALPIWSPTQAGATNHLFAYTSLHVFHDFAYVLHVCNMIGIFTITRFVFYEMARRSRRAGTVPQGLRSTGNSRQSGIVGCFWGARGIRWRFTTIGLC